MSPSDEHSDQALRQRYLALLDAAPHLSTIDVITNARGVESVPLGELYIEPALTGLANLADVASRLRLVIMGESGLGKTSLLKYLNRRLAGEWGEGVGETTVWPLYVRLDLYVASGMGSDLLSFALDDLLGPGGEPALRERLRQKNDAGELFLLCDGFDEVTEGLNRLLPALTRHQRYIVAVRPRPGLRLGQETGGTLQLQRFDRARIAAFVDRWTAVAAAAGSRFNGRQLLDQLNQDRDLFDLAQNPQFLGLICFLWGRGERALRTRSGVFGRAWRSLLDQELRAVSAAERLRVETAVQHLAFDSFQAGRSPIYTDRQIYAVGQALYGVETADRILEAILATGLLSDQPQQPGAYSFLYRGFQEFLAAEYLVAQPDFLDRIIPLQFQPGWAEVVRLAVGILGQDDGRLPQLRQLLRKLADMANVRDIFGLHWQFVGYCLSEIHPDVVNRLGPLPRRMAEAIMNAWLENPETRALYFPLFEHWRSPAIFDRLRALADDPGQPIFTRSLALIGLGSYPPEQAAPYLRRRWQAETQTNLRAATALGLLNDPDTDTGQLLTNALADPDPQVSFMTATIVGLRGERALAGPLLDAWFDHASRLTGDDSSFFTSFQPLAYLGAIVRLRPEATVPLLLDYLTGDWVDEDRLLALTILSEARQRAAVWPAIQLLRDESVDLEIRTAAAGVLINLGTSLGLSEVLAAAQSGDSQLQARILFALGVNFSIRQSGALAIMGINDMEETATGLMLQQIQRELGEVQIAENGRLIDERVAEEGREAVLAEAEAAFNQPVGSAPAAMVDLWNVVQAAMTEDDALINRVAALEMLHHLDPQEERLLAAIHDPDLPVAMRAIFWLQQMSDRLSLDRWLAQYEQLEGEAFTQQRVSLQGVLGQLRFLCPLLSQYRAGKKATRAILWLISMLYDLLPHHDGRIVLADGTVFDKCDDAVAEISSRIDWGDPLFQLSAADAELQLAAARQEYEANRQLTPGDVDGWLARAAINHFLDYDDAALEDLAAAIDLDHSQPRSHYQQGQILLQKKHYADAAEALAQAAEHGLQTADLYASLGEAHWRADQNEQAIVAFDEALARQPDDDWVLMARGFSWSGLDDPAKALADFQAAIRLNPERALAYQAIRKLYANEDDVDGYRAFLDTVLDEYSDSIAARQARADAAYEAGAHAGAVADYHELVRRRPRDSKLWLGLGQAELALGEFNEAVESLQISRALYLESGQLSQLEMLMAIYGGGAGLPGSQPLADALWGRAQQLLAAGHPTAAANDLQELLKLQPKHAEAQALATQLADEKAAREALLEQADDHAAAQDYQAALAAVDEAIAVNPNYGDPYVYRAEMLTALGDLPAAHGAYQQAMALGVDDATVYRAAARLLLEGLKSDLPQAVAWNRRTLELTEDEGRRAALMLSEAAQYTQYINAEGLWHTYDEQALPLLDRLIELLPDLEAAAERHTAGWTEGEEAAQREGLLAAVAPAAFAWAYQFRGTLRQLREELAPARIDLEQALALGSTEPELYNNLAWLYAEQLGTELEKATELAQQAAATPELSDADRANYLDTLGWVYFKRGLHDQAAATLREALALHDDPEAQARLAQVEAAQAAGQEE